jgi:hypothetical protein
VNKLLRDPSSSELELAARILPEIADVAHFKAAAWRPATEKMRPQVPLQQSRGDCAPPRRRIFGDDPRTCANRAEREIGQIQRIAEEALLSGSALDRKSRGHAPISIDSPRCPQT